MNYKGHRNGAIFIIASTLIIKDSFTISETIKIISGVYLGSFLPDIDHSKSTIKNKIPLLKLYNLLPKNKWTMKRGRMFHSVYTLLFIAFLYVITGNTFFIHLFNGVLGHHLLDMTTSAGLKNYFK